MAWQRYKDICKSFIELYFIEKLTFLDKKITLNEAFKTHQRVASQPNRTEPNRTDPNQSPFLSISLHRIQSKISFKYTLC